MARGCLESLEALIEAGPGLDAAVITGAVRCWRRDLRLGVIGGGVGHVATRAGAGVRSSVGGEAGAGGGRAVVVAAGLVTKMGEIL